MALFSQFVDALAAAKKRGVDVRVLLDGVGRFYSFPTIVRAFKRCGIIVGIFLDPVSFKGIRFNLRNHRKLLIVDGHKGFTGGMNISHRHVVQKNKVSRKTQGITRAPVIDIHFLFEGPVVAHLEEGFLVDWYFVTKQLTPVNGDSLPYDTEGAEAWCRGISAGPNNELERLYWVVVAALSVARKKIRIMTPYFVPDRGLLTAICAAALRGVEVTLVLPQVNNIPLIHWASRAYLYEIIQSGVRVYYQPPPFVHSKLLLIDDVYSLVGSINLDARSLRLNFELCVESYDANLTTQLVKQYDEIVRHSQEVTIPWLEKRPVFYKLVDGAAKLFSPYL